MFCNNCICHRCPYGLTCRDCDTWLDGHILLIEGCNGQRETDECLFDYIARVETGVHEHAKMLREMIRNRDSAAIEAFFDHKTGPYHLKSRERYAVYLKNLEGKKKHAND